MNIDILLNDIEKICLSKEYSSPYTESIKKIYHFNNSRAIEYLKCIQNLLCKFKESFPLNNNIFVLRVPGRVNLIGEHLDYNGLPVLPMAIEKNIICIFSQRNEPKVSVRNFNSDYSNCEFDLITDRKPNQMGDWINYIKAGIFGLNPKIDHEISGFNALIYSDLPIASGLSSSSALVVVSAMAFLKVNNIVYKNVDLAEKLAIAEHYVGTMGGGMDQAVILNGKDNQALRIDFFPLKIKSIPFPEEYSFIIADSCVKSSKTDTMLVEYNRRPIECKMATSIIEKILDKKYDEYIDFNRLGDVFKSKSIFNKLNLQQSLDMFFPHESYQVDTILKILELDENEFNKKFLSLNEGRTFPIPGDGFKLRQRFQFIRGESIRVAESIMAIENKNISKFGKLMVEAHYQARDLYEISCYELDRLVAIAIESGALGARLTGAGFGGCCIILAKNTQKESIIYSIIKKYYKDFLFTERRDLFEKIKDVNKCLFVCNPSEGAEYLFDS